MRCPAKLNLFLRVVSKRDDGYHELETVFQTIDLCDELEARNSTGRIRLRCDAPDVPTDHSNLVIQAASLLRSRPEASVSAGAIITLRKHIPVGGGLGGGSSDAACALRLLNELWELNLPDKALQRLALDLGSDVPFFQRGGAAVGRGRGEILEPLPDGEPLWFVLAKPKEGVSTPWAFSILRPEADDGVSIDDFLAARREGSPQALAPCLRNDLEPAVMAAREDVAAVAAALRAAGAIGVRMTGSGAAVFGLCEGESHAREVAERLDSPAIDWKTVARSLGAEATELL